MATSPRILPYVCTDTEPYGWVINTPLIYPCRPAGAGHARYRLIIIEFRLFREDSGHPLTGAARRELRTCLPNSGPAFFGSPCVLPVLPTLVGTLAIANCPLRTLSFLSRPNTGSFRLLRCLRQLLYLHSRRVWIMLSNRYTFSPIYSVFFYRVLGFRDEFYKCLKLFRTVYWYFEFFLKTLSSVKKRKCLFSTSKVPNLLQIFQATQIVENTIILYVRHATVFRCTSLIASD